MQQTVNKILSEIADTLVSAGIYQDTTKALLAIATDFIALYSRRFTDFADTDLPKNVKHSSNQRGLIISGY